MEACTRDFRLCSLETYIVMTGMRVGDIIEKSGNADGENIFDLYEMPTSEINFVKKMTGSDRKRIFAIKTLDGNVLIFLRQVLSSYTMLVIKTGIPEVRGLIDGGVDICISPTLARYVRKCHTVDVNVIMEALGDVMFLFLEDISDREYVKKGIIGYSAVYNCNIQLCEKIESKYLGADAVISREFLDMLFMSVSVLASKYGSADISCEICDRGNIFSAEIFIDKCDGDGKEKLLNILCELSDMLCVWFTYEYVDGGIKIYACPYFVDDGLLGVKSRIIFEK